MLKKTIINPMLTYLDIKQYNWADLAPQYTRLAEQPLTPDNVSAWLADWRSVYDIASELFSRAYVNRTLDTTNAEYNERYTDLIENFWPQIVENETALKKKLLESGLTPPGLEVPMRDIRGDAALFRAENLPLHTEEEKLVMQYDKIIGTQSVEWQGETKTLIQLEAELQNTDRTHREKAWRAIMERKQADRTALNELWGELLNLRQKIAHNAGLPSFREYAWHQKHRWDYSPADCKQFQQAIAEVVVPVASQIYAQRKAKLGVSELRPWDLEVDASGLPAMRPFADDQELIARASNVFRQLDGDLSGEYETMRREQLLDLANRPGKAPGGYCIGFPLTSKPFIFMNAIGTSDNVRTLLHEAGHAFHAFAAVRLPYHSQQEIPMEFCEVASMSMELLSLPYLGKEQGGYFDSADAKRYLQEQLSDIVLFWPYMAVVDSFQHWVYENPQVAHSANACDDTWSALWQKFMPGVDWSGLEEHRATGWHRKLHIFRYPFYYVEYGLARLGAVQIWANSLKDPGKALEQYRHALSLGGTSTLPQLFAKAGGKLGFDTATMQAAMQVVQDQLA
ncbi:MAG TPA: M3 family oligoendopeptidase [Anaerolineales bacterium]|nr:M3 family oligoendopeptidase [Anaerolineales bacterium]